MSKLTEFLRLLKEKNYTQSTIIGYWHTLRKLSDKPHGEPLTKELILNFQAQFESLSITTRFLKSVQLKKFLEFAEPSLVKYVNIPKFNRPFPKKIPSQLEIKDILASSNPTTFLGIRDKAILEVLYSTGIRRAELWNLKLEDIQGRLLHITHGKGDKERVVPIGKKAEVWLTRYIKTVRSTFKPKDNFVFLTQHGKRFNVEHINRLVKQFSAVNPHKYRHAYATHLCQNGMKEASLQRLLGHTSINTSQIYISVTISDLKVSYAKYHPRDSWQLPPTPSLPKRGQGELLLNQEDLP